MLLGASAVVRFWHKADSLRGLTSRPLSGAKRTPRKGVVRLTIHELASRRRSRPSRCELTPFRESGSAVLLEDVAAVEVTVLVEVVVDRGMGGGELLESFQFPEFRHRSFSSSEWLV
jgi:hypothetical protein